MFNYCTVSTWEFYFEVTNPSFSLQLGKVYGIESHVLSPAETKDLYPLMNVDDLYGTLYVPKDGTMDPAGTCTTLSRAASARGAMVGVHGSAAGLRLLPLTSRCPFWTR